jgi:hypothetical protein
MKGGKLLEREQPLNIPPNNSAESQPGLKVSSFEISAKQLTKSWFVM